MLALAVAVFTPATAWAYFTLDASGVSSNGPGVPLWPSGYSRVCNWEGSVVNKESRLLDQNTWPFPLLGSGRIYAPLTDSRPNEPGYMVAIFAGRAAGWAYENGEFCCPLPYVGNGNGTRIMTTQKSAPVGDVTSYLGGTAELKSWGFTLTPVYGHTSEPELVLPAPYNTGVKTVGPEFRHPQWLSHWVEYVGIAQRMFDGKYRLKLRRWWCVEGDHGKYFHHTQVFTGLTYSEMMQRIKPASVEAPATPVSWAGIDGAVPFGQSKWQEETLTMAGGSVLTTSQVAAAWSVEEDNDTHPDPRDQAYQGDEHEEEPGISDPPTASVDATSVPGVGDIGAWIQERVAWVRDLPNKFKGLFWPLYALKEW